MRILITGGAGYIGTELVQALDRTDWAKTITVYDNLSRPNHNLFLGVKKLSKKVRFIQGDILDSRKLQRAVSLHDAVYHLAAKVTTPFADHSAHLFEQVNNWGTAEVAYAVEKSSVKKLVYLSSVSVYGSGDEEKTLDSNLDPKTFYGISKLRGEEHVARLKDHCHVNILRGGNVYGYNKSMRFDAVINRFMFDANFKGKIHVNGSGAQNRAFISVADTVHCLVQVAQGDYEAPIYNLVRHNRSINDIILALREVYPDLEMIFMNQHMKMRELKVRPDARLEGLMLPEKDLVEELRAIASGFAF